MKALLLSNVNMQPLAAFLKPWEAVSGEFNSILLDLANPDSAANSEEFTHILCLYDSDTMMGEAAYGDSDSGQCDSFLAALETFCAAHPGKIVAANTFCFGATRWLNFADLLHPQSLRSTEYRLNDRLISIARTYPNLLLVDIELIFRQHGEDALLSAPFWYLGRIRYTNQMFRSLARTLHQAVDAWANRSRKVLVLDLDNTLWGGIVGETGPLGIALSEDGEGRCYRDFQRALKGLQRTGVLLTICSKNNLGDLDEVFDRNPMMILHSEDFACIRANWQSKPENILDIAQTLNLGIDSFVFIDDNPVERDMVATA
ncbi:MAG TPA: HAD-IIIC family phosphatase, partial [Pseudacidobacterium sp.]|nr:HAD-IIIC family phosphatase [Pseudacidobacterium sp.]